MKILNVTIAQSLVIKSAVDYIFNARKYSTFEEWYDEEVGPRMNCTARTAKLLKHNDKGFYDSMRESYQDALKGITVVYAKTETVKSLEKKGYVSIVKHAEYKNGPEVIKVSEEVLA